MKFYKAFKMKNDDTAEGGFKFSLCSTECYEENGELVDIEVGYDGGKVINEVVKKDGVELEVSRSAKRCLESSCVCGCPFFFKVEVPEGAVIDEDAEHGYTVVKEFRIVRELTFDDMMVLATKEATYPMKLCQAESMDGDTEETSDQRGVAERMQRAHELGQRAGELVVKCLGKYDELIEIEQDLEKRQEVFETEKKNAAVRRRKEQDFLARVERENKRLRSENLERKRLLPFWLSAVAIFGMVIGYFIGFLLGLTI